MCTGFVVGPVEKNLRRGNLVDFADLGVDRVFAWLKGLGPNPLLPCAHDLRVDVGVARVESVFPSQSLSMPSQISVPGVRATALQAAALLGIAAF